MNSTLTNNNTTLTNATTTASNPVQVISILTLNSLGSSVFLLMVIVMSILLIIQWKTMVLNKRIMSIILIITCLNQHVYQTCGFIGYLSSFLKGPAQVGAVFLGLEFAGYLLSLTLCLNCQVFITKVLYGVYFNESQAWMRNSKANSILRKFVKFSSIAIVSILNLQLVLSLPFAFMYSIILKANILSVSQASDIRQFTGIFHPTLGGIISLFFLYFSGLNLFLSISLIRKLYLSLSVVTDQKKNCCRKLIVLSVGQVLMALINIIGIILIGLSNLITLAMFVVALASHRIAIFLFCVFVNFSFGPLDDVSELGEQLAQVMKRGSLSIKEDIKFKDTVAKVSNKVSSV